ncbi:hypothetical protein BDP81DRAFT_415746 [Colletotrichum phormii]|uniref:Secreted protein n=1 Tax=Colletotrichum phormii TaxID=359342 RepID=A0AAJ0A4H2_9PEZI|nr:uncharacterized protein BDP81DRAFT_415746 [Colletotrichum phormii]KAK1654445.1 hypothetical protein BDP81DRAFT_415746 [Colletotrichum phormii]
MHSPALCAHVSATHAFWLLLSFAPKQGTYLLRCLECLILVSPDFPIANPVWPPNTCRVYLSAKGLEYVTDI